MQEIVKLIIGVIVLTLGIPIGDFLKSKTQEELKGGKKWFKLIVSFSVLGGFIGLLLQNDWIMFSLFFMAIVTSRSLVLKK